MIALIMVLSLAGCSPDQILGSDTLPPDVADPAQAKTPDGALALYRGAVASFASAFGGNLSGVIIPTALITDELGSADVGLPGFSNALMYVDARELPEYSDPALEPASGSASPTASTAYEALQRARGQIAQARGALRAYAPDAPVALQGRLYAFDGYIKTFLADLFCSGVPLSTLDFDGDFTYAAGSTTEELYERAEADFDSALALAGDSADVTNLARIGKARAQLDLGQYDAARQSVSGIPTTFQYRVTFSASDADAARDFAFHLSLESSAGRFTGATMTDREGGNGLPYLSSQDPRTPTEFVGQGLYGTPVYRPAAYSSDGSTPITLASGIEARLIEAEAQLHAGDASWLATLNDLRTDGTFDTQVDPNDAAKTDTLWHAGSGGVAGLAPLTDPGTPETRVDLVFRERAYWLFLTAHRQGDLRRLVREYARDPGTVYPTGAYTGLNGQYGSAVNAPIPAEERLYNPQFHGCLNRGA